MHRTRLAILYGLLLMGALSLAGRLFFVQVVGGDELRERGEHQYVSSSSGSFDRGKIFFTRKDGLPISAATLAEEFSIEINPRMLKDVQKLYDILAPAVPNFNKEAYFFAAQKDDPSEVVAKGLSKAEAELLSEKIKDIDGVMLVRSKKRFYPGGSLGAHLLGFVGFSEDELRGLYGVERYYDDILSRDQSDSYVNFFAEMFANVSHTLLYEKNNEGDIFLTIEPEVERFVEAQIDALMKKWNAAEAGAIIINPKTGAVYALAARPAFDPNRYSAETNYARFGNPLVETVFEMGSIVKPLTMAIGIDTKAITPESTYTDRGFVLLDGARIENFDGKARGTVPMQEILNQSLNTGVVHVMTRVGKDAFAQYLLNLGLGEETGIDLPNETHGLVDNLRSPRMLEYATASFGQGIAVTPVGITRALSALANGGLVVTPHIASRIDYPIAPSRVISYSDDKRVFKKESVEAVTSMLVTVVDEALAEGKVKMDHYSIAAKTGTAQIAKKESGGYYDDRYTHSFFGYFPAYDAQFLIFLYMHEPVGARYASQTLTDPFMHMVKFLINYYEVPPDR